MVKMNRPRQLNAMSWGMEQDMKKTLDWFEEEPSLWVVILTGNGRAFCAGQVGLFPVLDLKTIDAKVLPCHV